MSSPILEAIFKRRSIREYTDKDVTTEHLHKIIEAGIWAPSGLNNQPWRFVTIKDQKTRNQLAAQTKYGHIINAAPALIAVYLDQTAMYNNTKDHQAAGACIENMLLASEALGLGAVWLGQILQKKEEVNTLLDLNNDLDLMAIVAIGHPAHHDQQSQRKPLRDFILKEL